MKTITPPEGVKRINDSDKPQDEGTELIDCEGSELDTGQHLEILHEDEEQNTPSTSTTNTSLNSSINA